MYYGDNEKKRECRTADNISGEADEIRAKDARLVRPGGQRKTGEDGADWPDRAFKDSRKWTAQTKEQAQ